jgi:hypothetical protein
MVLGCRGCNEMQPAETSSYAHSYAHVLLVRAKPDCHERPGSELIVKRQLSARRREHREAQEPHIAAAFDSDDRLLPAALFQRMTPGLYQALLPSRRSSERQRGMRPEAAEG